MACTVLLLVCSSTLSEKSNIKSWSLVIDQQRSQNDIMSFSVDNRFEMAPMNTQEPPETTTLQLKSSHAPWTTLKYGSFSYKRHYILRTASLFRVETIFVIIVMACPNSSHRMLCVAMKFMQCYPRAFAGVVSLWSAKYCFTRSKDIYEFTLLWHLPTVQSFGNREEPWNSNNEIRLRVERKCWFGCMYVHPCWWCTLNTQLFQWQPR